MTEKSPEREGLDRLADDLVDNILSASDEEVLTEFRESQGDPDRHVADMRALFEASVLAAKKRRLAQAKAGAQAQRETRNITARPPDMAAARRRLRAILDDPTAQHGLTLAARKESELSDADILSLLDDLRELGVPLPDGGSDGSA